MNHAKLLMHLLVVLNFCATSSAHAGAGRSPAQMNSCAQLFSRIGTGPSKQGYWSVAPVRSRGQMFGKYREAAPGRETFVLLHGLTADNTEWREVAKNLAANGYGVLVLDLLNSGKTLAANAAAGFDVTNITLRDQVTAVAGVLRQLGIKKIRLVGHSYGGAVAHQLAAMNAFDVSGLHLISPYVKRTDFFIANQFVNKTPFAPFWNMTHGWMDIFMPGLFQGLTEANGQTFGRGIAYNEFRKMILEKATANGEHLTPQELHLGALADVHAVWDLLQYNALTNPPPVSRSIPIQLIVGTHDEINPVENMNGLFYNFQSSGNSVLPTTIQASHYIPTDAPLDLVKSLMATTQRASP